MVTPVSFFSLVTLRCGRGSEGFVGFTLFAEERIKIMILSDREAEIVEKAFVFPRRILFVFV